MLAQLERATQHVEGRRAVLSLHVSRNAGVGARAEGGALPTAGYQGYVEERVTLAYNYLRIKVSGQAMKATVNDSGSFVRALSNEMTNGVNDLRRDVNRQIFNDGNDRIATCGTTSGATTIVLAATTTALQLSLLEPHTKIDIGSATNPTSRASAHFILTVDKAASPPTMTVSATQGGSAASLTTAGTDFITRSGSQTADGGGNLKHELTGLREIVKASGTLHNVDPTSQPVWKSIANDNSGTNRAATDNLFEVVIDDIDTEAGKSPNFCVTSKGVRRNYAAQLKSMKRFNDGASITLKGGFKALTIDCGDVSLPIAADRDCPNNTAFLLNLNHIKQHEMSDWEWADYDGAVLRNTSGYDQWEAFMFKYHEICTDQRNTHGIISDLTES